MNKVFAEATTSTAFLLTLTKRQCNTLLRLRAHEQKFGKPDKLRALQPKDERDDGPASINIVQHDSLTGLRSRGLVFWHHDETGRCAGFGGLTKAGELMSDLLAEAGLTIENTNTLSVLRRLDRAA